jgi:hypothetical protein
LVSLLIRNQTIPHIYAKPLANQKNGGIGSDQHDMALMRNKHVYAKLQTMLNRASWNKFYYTVMIISSATECKL